MEVSDWLVVVLLIAFVVVLLDGVRRKLRDRRDRVVVKLDRSVPAVDATDDVVALAELPNGGARTLPRNDRPPPTLRNLKSTRKPLFDNPPRREPAADSHARPVPVLMDTVDVEEQQIEHAHVFADSSRPADFLADDYEDAGAAFRARLADDGNDVDEDEEDTVMRAVQPVARHHQVADTRYYGDEDEDDFDEEEFEDEDEEFDDEDEEFDEDDEEDDDELPLPGVTRARDDDDDFDFDDDDDDNDDDNDDDDDDFDDDDEDLDDDDKEADQEIEDDDEVDEDDEEDDDVDELGFPDDNFGSEEEMDQLVADDYENEPVLLESTYGKAASHFNRSSSRQPRREPGFGDNTFDESEFDEDFSAANTATGDDQQGEAIRPVPLTPRPAPAQAESLVPHTGQQNLRDKAVPGKQDQVDLFREVPSAAARAEARAAAARPGKPQPAVEPRPAPGPQEVIIINVMARPGQTLAGYELLPVLQQQGLRLGDMSIFHRHAEQNGDGPVVFSMANMVKPGTFELASMMEDFTTPGVSFFLQIPNELGNMPAFELLLGAATAVRNALDGELKDENRSVFTRQTVEHCRQRIRDFELKLLSRKN